MNTFTSTTTNNLMQLTSMPWHLSAYTCRIGKPVFVRVMAVVVATVRGVFSLK